MKSIPIKDVSDELRDINDNVEHSTPVTLISYNDGHWAIFIGDESDRAERFGGKHAHGRIPGHGNEFDAWSLAVQMLTEIRDQ
jgi:hypothetical protein